MMTMKEMLEAGYTVTVGSMFGDMIAEDAEDFDDVELVEVDDTAKTAYFYEVDAGQYDE